MDEETNISEKKQSQIKYRQRVRKDRRFKQQEKPTVPAGTSEDTSESNVSDPQPQRANRRQRNEAPATSLSIAATTTPSDNTGDAKVSAEKENVTIDFSNLKRETEEIAKLTKKFAKRNITSNWHRYSPPEGPQDDGDAEEEAPADFSALIQVPASKGGHLQLKDEQEWLSASNQQLGGYFALNLKLLDQSLACIPLYEQLRLPKHMFTEEEIKYFDTLASQARTIYNPNSIEDPNESGRKKLTSLLQKETDARDPETRNDIESSKSVSILDAEGNQDKLLNIDLQPKIPSENYVENISNLSESAKQPSEKFNLPLRIANEIDGNSNIQNNIDHNRSVVSLDRVCNKPEEKEILPLSNGQDQILQIDEPMKFIEPKNKTSIETVKEIPQPIANTPEGMVLERSQDENVKTGRQTSEKTIVAHNTSNNETSLNLEDDNDLDFLLSLKKTTQPENKKLKSIPEKDSSDGPGKKKSSKPPPTQQHSELDDWLDSVLQD